ncbi:MAG: T9SS type A sorting domain-containing protein [Bacteroidales bacterium]|nr:T9SS type A sorting domain-containing protein [Bacteroidales bacterium]
MAQLWPKIYGDNFHSLVNDLHESYDQGYILTAFTYNSQGIPKHAWIIKTDINGNVLWDKKIGDGNYRNWFSQSTITSDEGFIISGSTGKYSSGDNDPVFIKMNVCGEVEWCRVFPSPDQNYGIDIIQLQDHSYVGLLKYYGEGPGYARISLVKMDPSGEPVWIQQLAQEDTLIYNEEGGYLYLNADGNYLVSGRAYHPGLRPFWIKTDSSGVQIWDLFWNDITGQAHQVVEISNGIFYSTGWGFNDSRPQSPILMKFDNEGNSIERFFLMGDTIHQGSASPIISLSDSTFMIGLTWKIGEFPNFNEFSAVHVTDSSGICLNRRILLNKYMVPRKIIKTNDDKILVTGSYVIDNNWDIYLWKMNADLEDDTLYTQPMVYDSLCPYQILSDTIDLDCDIFVNFEDLPTKEVYESTIKISPNPARDWSLLTFPENFKNDHIYLTVYNTFGQVVIQKEVTITNSMYTLETSGLPSGLYITICRDKKKNAARGKFVVVR